MRVNCPFFTNDCLVISRGTISGNEINIESGTVADTSNNARATGAGLSLVGAGDPELQYREAGITNSTIAHNKIVSTVTGCDTVTPQACRVPGGGIWFKRILGDRIFHHCLQRGKSSIDNVSAGGIHVDEEGDALLSLKLPLWPTISTTRRCRTIPTILSPWIPSPASQGYNLFDDRHPTLVLALPVIERVKECLFSGPLTIGVGPPTRLRPGPARIRRSRHVNTFGPATGEPVSTSGDFCGRNRWVQPPISAPVERQNEECSGRVPLAGL